MSIENPYLHAKHPDNAYHLRLKRWAVIASLSVATLLVSVKFFAYILTDSVSVLSTLMDSGFDGLASLVTMLSITHAAIPADRDHRFGHEKSEALAAMAQAVFIFGSGLFLLSESVQRFVHPARVVEVEAGFYTVALSIVLTGLLIVFQQFVIRKTSSVAVNADYMHYKGDLLMNFGVFIALAVSTYSPWSFFDPLFAFCIALFLFHSALGVGREAFDILLDKEIPNKDREKIIELVQGHPDVMSIHDLRTRSTGQRIFIEFHMEMDGKMTLDAAHDVTEDIERVLYNAFPKSEVLIHQEPDGLDHEHHKLDDILET